MQLTPVTAGRADRSKERRQLARNRRISMRRWCVEEGEDVGLVLEEACVKLLGGVDVLSRSHVHQALVAGHFVARDARKHVLDLVEELSVGLERQAVGRRREYVARQQYA